MDQEEPTATGMNKAQVVWRLLLAIGMTAFLAYGLSAFFSRPTSETITTHPPKFDSNTQPMQNAGYGSNRRRR